MFTFDVIGAFVLILALAAVLLMVLLIRTQRTGRDLPLWFASALVGILMGAAGAAALAGGLGYKFVKRTDAGTGSPMGGTAAPAGAAPSGAGLAGPGGGMASPAGAGMMGPPGGGMMGGGRGPSPKRQLTSLVRKLDLLTGDIALSLTPEQSAKLATVLDELKASPTLTDDEANAKYEQVLALLDDSQKAKQDAIGLPFRRGGGGPGTGGPGGAGPGGAGPGGPPGGPPAPDANPFSDEENAKALTALLSRVGGERPAAEQPTSDAAKAAAEPDTSEK